MESILLLIRRSLIPIVLFILLANQLNAQCTPAKRTADSLILVALYNATNGAGWTNPWNLSQPMNTWAGVGISQGCVIDLFLGSRGLNGTLPAEIGNLSSINVNFWISGNPNLTGPIPASVGNLNQVKKFFLHTNSLSGPIPETVGGMTSVVEFDVCCNDLTGPIPSTFGNLDNLKSLVLNDNLINGPIPTNLNEMGALTSLWLGNNQLTGTIPASIGDIPNLTILYLPLNNLSGCIPAALRKLCPKVTYGHVFGNPQLSTQSWSDFCNSGEGRCPCTEHKLPLILPRANTIGVNYINTVFEWDRADGPSHTIKYDLIVKNNQNVIVIDEKNLSGTRYVSQIPLLTLETYKWQVKSKIDGNIINWSDEIEFTTDNAYQFMVNPEGSRRDNANPNINAYRNSWNNTPIFFGSTHRPSCNKKDYCSRIDCNCEFNVALGDVITGLKWQCVEYVNRYYYHNYGLKLLNVLGGGNAINYKDYSEYGLEFYKNINLNKPKLGDIVIWEGGVENSGHVAIITGVRPGFVDVAQQNTGGASSVLRSYALTTTVHGDSIGRFESDVRACAGWARVVPRLSFPQDGATNIPLNPTFRFERKIKPRYLLELFKKDSNECYESIHSSNLISSNQYNLPTLLEPGKEYLVYFKTIIGGANQGGTILPFDTTTSKAVFFRTSNVVNTNIPVEQSISGCDTALAQSLRFFLYKTNVNPLVPISGVRIYVKLGSSWQDAGTTDVNGNFFFSDINPAISMGDSIQAISRGFEPVYMVMNGNMINEGIVRIPLVSQANSSNLILNVAAAPWVNNAPMPGLYVTQPNIQIHVTAENHSQYHLITPTELDDSVGVESYPAAQELLSVNLNIGYNVFYIVYTNNFDTVFYSTVINYYPLDDLSQYTYDVLVEGDTTSTGASVYVNGTFVKLLTGQNEIIKVPDIKCSFAFSKPGYSNYFETTVQQDTISIPWQEFVPNEPIPVQAAIKAILQGSYVPAAQLMHDSLRSKNLIPLTEPYTNLTNFTHISGGSEQTTPAVLAVTGPNAIVDWIFLEMHSAANPVQVLATRSALLQRDGDVVDVDGVSAVVFNIPADQSYYPAVRHRNHLGVQWGEAVFYPACEAVETDFTSTPNEGFFAFNGLNSAQKTVNGKNVLWAGNGRVDYQLKYNGSNNDRTAILSVVGLSTPNAVVPGYNLADYNLDGVVKYNGSANDRNVLLGNVGITTPSAIVNDQVGR